MGRSENWKTRMYAIGRDQAKCGWYRKPVVLKKILQDSPAPWFVRTETKQTTTIGGRPESA